MWVLHGIYDICHYMSIPVSMWLIDSVTSGLTLKGLRLSPCITRVITYLLSGMNHQVYNTNNDMSETMSESCVSVGITRSRGCCFSGCNWRENTSYSQNIKMRFLLPSGKLTQLLKIAIEIVDFPIYSMVDLSIVFCMFTRGYMGVS